MEKNGTFASPVTGNQQSLALFRRSSQQHAFRNASAQLLELLRLAQKFDNFFQLFLGSSTPATSLNVTFFCCIESNRARLLPNDNALLPPVCICRIMKNHNAASRISGAQVPSNCRGQLPLVISRM